MWPAPHAGSRQLICARALLLSKMRQFEKGLRFRASGGAARMSLIGRVEHSTLNVLHNHRSAGQLVVYFRPLALRKRRMGLQADQIRVRHQPADRQGARNRNTAIAAGPRRRDDRVSAKIRRHAFIALIGGAVRQHRLPSRLPRLFAIVRQIAPKTASGSSPHLRKRLR
jgi:hypothetical protein